MVVMPVVDMTAAMRTVTIMTMESRAVDKEDDVAAVAGAGMVSDSMTITMVMMTMLKVTLMLADLMSR